MENTNSLTASQSTGLVAQRPFRPVSFRKSVLTCTTIATFLLLCITGYLHHLNHQNGAILSGQRGGPLSAIQIFQVRYLPTILIVLYGSWVTVLDLDVKRLEPWLRLSLPAAPADISPLLCRYDTDFVLTVLAKATVNR